MENLGNHRGVGRIFGLIPLLQMNGEKVHFCPFFILLCTILGQPIYLSSFFLFSYLILVGLLERNGREVGSSCFGGMECLGALLGLVCLVSSREDGFFFTCYMFVSPSQASGVLGGGK